MIELADSRLVEWIKEVLGDPAVTLGPPGATTVRPVVSCYLLALTGAAPSRVAHTTTFGLELRYLLTTFADPPEEAHRLLSQLAFAAMGHPDWTPDFAPLSADTWSAFNVPPQPAFVLRVPLHWERAEPPVKRVLRPLEVQYADLGTFQGVLLGPGDRPLAYASLALQEPELATMTDEDGRFYFGAVPSQPRSRHLVILAKGQVFDLTVEQPSSDALPVEIRLKLS